MRKFKFDKLVRDKIVENITNSGGKVDYRKLDDQEFTTELKRKLFEEAAEIPFADGEELIKELADIQEIIDTLLRSLKIDKQNFEEIKQQKNLKAGVFQNKDYISAAEIPDDSSWLEHFTSEPEKYPEIKSST